VAGCHKGTKGISSHHSTHDVVSLFHKPMQTHENGALTVLVSAALAAVIAYAVYAVVYNVYLHPLAKFPGPPLARTTIYWKAYVECIAQRSFCHVLVDLHARYGEMALASGKLPQYTNVR
jgi:hypothetical protein